jgi:hypothetical protein
MIISIFASIVCGHALMPKKNAGDRRLSLLFCLDIPSFRRKSPLPTESQAPRFPAIQTTVLQSPELSVCQNHSEQPTTY